MESFAGHTFILASIAAGLLAGTSCSTPCENYGGCGTFNPTGGSGGSAGTSAASGNSGASGRGGAGISGSGGEAGQTAGLAGTSGSAPTAGSSGKGGGAGSSTGGTSGEGGGAGIGGGGGAEPCDGACKGTTPVCDDATNTCVGCLRNSQCAGQRPVCDKPTNTCVECNAENSNKCQGATPACNVSTKICVECTAADSSECHGDTPVCDTEANQCVGCIRSDDCALTTAARCGGNSTCVACVTDGDCTHLDGTHVCASGTCVQCTATNETACGTNSCNPATHACTTTPRGSVGTCEPCVADSECTGGDQADPDQRCVPMEFQGVERLAGFCLRRVVKTCARPYEIPITVSSLSGATGEAYCGIDEDTTRCEAVLDLLNSQACSDGQDSSCGCARDSDGNCIEPGLGGLCRTVGVNPKRCSYQCGTLDDCPTGKTCSGSTPPTYCQ